jgi:hypothetical protein
VQIDFAGGGGIHGRDGSSPARACLSRPLFARFLRLNLRR